MAKPTIVAVDDDAQVLRAVERDLRTRYANTYRIVATGSGAEAVETVRTLAARGDLIALLLSDQRMPGMTGTEFLKESIAFAPGAKRVLLTAYADTSVAIEAINDIGLDHYILKPWEPPDERLYPVLDELLYDWQTEFQLTKEGAKVLAERWSPAATAVREFLTRNQVPYRWPPTDSDEARSLIAALGETERLIGANTVTVVLENGTVLRDPTNRALADALGLSTSAAMPFYDLVIVGGGPAGLAAAVYGASEGLKTLLVERDAPGGQAGTTSRIENYLGFPAGVTGAHLAQRALGQAQRLGTEIVSPRDVESIRRDDPYRTIVLGGGDEVACQACVVATGVSYQRLGVPGTDALAGAGVYYGASTADAMLYKDGCVGVLGGGNSAGQAAVHLARCAGNVHLFARRPLADTMSTYLIEQIADHSDTIHLHVGTEMTAAHGDGRLERASFSTSEGPFELPLDALFVFIGQRPRTEWLDGVVARDEKGFILAGPDLAPLGKRPPGWGIEREPFLLETSIPGVFAAGDVRHASVKRIASAVGEGAMAIQFVHRYLATL